MSRRAEFRRHDIVHSVVAFDLHFRGRLVAQFGPAYLPGDRLRKVLDELDLAGVLVGAELVPDVLLDVVGRPGGRLGVGARHDVGLDDVAAFLVGLGNDGPLGDRGVFAQRRLDLEGADAVARRDDDVVGAALEPEVTVLVAVADVAGEIPLAVRSVDETVGGLVRFLPVPGEEAREVGALGYLASLAGR